MHSNMYLGIEFLETLIFSQFNLFFAQSYNAKKSEISPALPLKNSCLYRTCFSYSSLVLRIRIRIDPHHFGNLDPHQIKIRIRIKRDPETDGHQFADDKSKCMDMSQYFSTFSRV
jgi:hypothetical protein